MNFCMVRYIFQLHNVHGGFLGGADRGGAQLPPPDGGHTRDAAVGEYSALIQSSPLPVARPSLMSPYFYPWIKH